MKYFVSRENLLDLIHSLGIEMKQMTSPSAHPYDDERRAKPYVAKHKACQQAWLSLKKGADEMEVVKWLNKKISEGNLWQSALLGEFEWSLEEFKQTHISHHWVTHSGDFYSVDGGDKLNLPRISRIANKNLPKELQKMEKVQELANLMPNPCTRITHPVLVS